MLDFEQFKKEYFEALKKELEPENISTEPHTLLSVNEKKEGICVQYPDVPVAPIIYYDEDYQAHRVLDKPVQELARAKAGDIMIMRHTLPEPPDIAKDPSRLYCTLVNRERNQELLLDTPHIDVADLAIVARYRVSDESSFLVRNEECFFLQMTGEEVLEMARENTRKEGYRCQPLGQVMMGLFSESGAPDQFIEDSQTRYDEPDIYVLTNRKGKDGAVAGADPKVLCDIREKIGRDFYILPSSRHELLLVPKDYGMEIEALEQMVKGVNETVVEEKDILSDKVYTPGPSMELTIASPEKSMEREPVMERAFSRGR